MGTGTDVAIDSAGVTRVRGGLRGIVRAVNLSRAAMRNVRHTTPVHPSSRRGPHESGRIVRNGCQDSVFLRSHHLARGRPGTPRTAFKPGRSGLPEGVSG